MKIAAQRQQIFVRFYQQVLGAPASLEQAGQGAAAQVRIGTYQWLTFRETDDEGNPINNTVAIGSLGGATLDNEENYLITKLFHSLGMVCIENQARI